MTVQGTHVQLQCPRRIAMFKFLFLLRFHKSYSSAFLPLPLQVMFTLLTQQQVSAKHVSPDYMYGSPRSPLESDMAAPLNILTTSNLSELITMLVKLLVERVEVDINQMTAPSASSSQSEDAEVRERDAEKLDTGFVIPKKKMALLLPNNYPFFFFCLFFFVHGFSIYDFLSAIKPFVPVLPHTANFRKSEQIIILVHHPNIS